ncbi:hypothetical protein HMPREF3023_04430 [Peptoniphilus sp. HMSC075B08]|uniref:threonine/serine exporter family protein n=1 Tax=Peptoniphilus sp. HMSC075B08 TaxID=1739525 RepID=UPI0008D21738|nr:threonine/serine exporter family protein [Peptoniphilus sp. HMSC075B08]OFO60091.1 hypothetical protein HMPREF3023_04430 [Peptoniphilus sp. HMSC075B08]
MIKKSIVQFFLSTLATYGFTTYFKLPKRVRIITSALSGFIWVVYELLFDFSNNYMVSYLLSSFLIGVCSESFAVYFKKPATVFTLPCLVPLVPGAGMYYIMYYFIESNYAVMREHVIKTTLTTSALALGIVLSQGIVRIIRELFRNYKNNRVNNNLSHE